MFKKPRTVNLTTDFEKDLTDFPWQEYPRPQLKRNSYLNLNGNWNFKIKGKNGIKYQGEILVPFVPESRISGVERQICKADVLVYERKFTLEKEFVKDKVLLHIGACDQYSKVFVNGQKVGENTGGYLPFSFDVTQYISIGENVLRIEATDPMDLELPYGKQTSKRGGMWYTKVSGIWQTVWMESVPKKYIERIFIVPNLAEVDITVEGGENTKILKFQNKEYEFSGKNFRLEVEDPHLWTPDDPYLYDFSVKSGGDEVTSYFGLRKVSYGFNNGKPCILINGEPVFFNGVLDQGYFSDGIFLPATEEGFKQDILKMKECGFNMLRKHIKLEPDLFYYYCDKYGMFIFQDFINSGKYNFLIDTAIPTVLPFFKFTHIATKKRRIEFEKTCVGIMENLYNHPSVVYYTIFNEGWGQFDADKYYNMFKSIDGSRIYDTASGWFKPRFSDVDSRHIYFKPVKLKTKNKPLILSEFGGYSCKVKNHAFNLDKTYGYRYYNMVGFFEDALVGLYENEIIPQIQNGLCGAVLTQLSDVEDETNGLLTYDRKVLKVNSEKLKALFTRLNNSFKGSELQ